jgi:hypothetical protein
MKIIKKVWVEQVAKTSTNVFREILYLELQPHIKRIALSRLGGTWSITTAIPAFCGI